MAVSDITGKSGAEVFVDTLNELGVDRIFLNPGFDLVPIMGAIAKAKADGDMAPDIILLPHESAAAAAAHGCAMVTGKPQFVALFEDVGTLQGGGALVNLQYGRVPVILCAGRNTAPLNRSNWRGDAFDQGKILRDYVKWDHCVSAGEDISTALREAFRVASAEPRGPVYLTFDREALLSRTGTKHVAAPADKKAYDMDLKDLASIAGQLLDAENPLILTAYLGRNPRTVPLLVEMAEMLAARVIPTDQWFNFPGTHPLCPGIDASAGHPYDHFIAKADVVLLLDYNFPGPGMKETCPGENACLIQIDLEPLKKGKYLWGRKPDLMLEGDSYEIIKKLNGMLRQRIRENPDPRIPERFDRIRREHEVIRNKWRSLAESGAKVAPISDDWLCACINEILDDDTILVHMIPSNAGGIARHIRGSRPGTLFSWGDNAGSMGWPLGAALGAKLAAPDHTVISLIGDGGFMYGEPIAALWSAKAYNAPFMTVVFNNGSYASIRQLMHIFHGPDSVAGDLGFEFGVDFRFPPDYAAIAGACDAYGETVDDPQKLRAALQKALEQLRLGRSAVLNVIIG